MKFPALNKLSALQLFQVTRFGTPFVISIILVRLIDKEGIGIYESLTLVGTSFTFFWVSGIINTFIPWYHSLAEEKRPLLIFNVYALLVCLSVLCFMVLLPIKQVFLPGSHHHIFFYFLVYNLFNAPAFFMEYLLVVKNRPKTLIGYGILSSGLQILALCLPLALGHDLSTGILCLGLSSLLKFALLTGYVVNTGQRKFDFVILKPFLKKAIPALLALVVGGSMPYIDSFIVLHYYDKASFAIYQYGAREMPLILLMANALSNVYSGEIASGNIGESLQKMKKSSKRLMHTLFPLTILLILFSEYLFENVYSEGFIESAEIFQVFMLLSISRLVFPQTVLTGLLKNKELLYFSAAEWMINLVLDFVFIQYFGMVGIAYATVIAYFFERIILVIYLQKIGYAPDSYIPVKVWAGYSVFVALAFAAVVAWG